MKKSILTFIGIIAATAVLIAGESNTLSVKIKKLKNTDGKLQVTLFDSEGNWLNNGEMQVVSVDNKSEVIVTFENVTPGTYAVSVVHDENNNGEMDTGLFGIPTEDYGFSNDAKGSFGPASFEDSKFEISANKEIEININ